jgi:hypothetical protein
MKRAYLREHGKSSLDLIEEALWLLRQAGPTTLAVYYLGAVPFVLGLLLFWADMSRSPFAAQHVVRTALGVALLFLWMKLCQTVFAGRLRAQLAGEVMPAWDLRRGGRAMLRQALFQSTALFVLPVALLMVLPFAWVFAFYQSTTLLDDGGRATVREVFLKASRHSSLWPGQNHALLLVLAGFGLVLFLNWLTVCGLLPHLASMLFGLETVFSRSPYTLLNSTFLATMLGLTYLCLDPLIRACYVLRGFYADSLTSGEDLKSELRRHSAAVPVLLPLVGLALLLGMAGVQGAAATGEASGSAERPVVVRTAIAPAEFDRVIDDVLGQAKYRWRLPREARVENAEQGMISRFFDDALKLLRSWVRTVVEWIEALLDRLFQRERGPSAGSTANWLTMTQGLLVLVIVVVACALGIFLYRLIRGQRRVLNVVASTAVQPVPDLADENLGADQLPEDEWSRLGRELMERGDLRLALRAFYLAGLSHLAGRGLVTIARFKSNRDYERELDRRGHALPGLAPIFGEAVSVFDRVWYGLQDVNDDLVRQFIGKVEQIKAVG